MLGPVRAPFGHLHFKHPPEPPDTPAAGRLSCIFRQPLNRLQPSGTPRLDEVFVVVSQQDMGTIDGIPHRFTEG